MGIFAKRMLSDVVDVVLAMSWVYAKSLKV